MPEIQVKDKLITLEELGTAINAKAGVTSVNNQTGAVSITPANIGAVAKAGDTMTGRLTISLGTGDSQERIIFLSPSVVGQLQIVANTTGTQQRFTFRQFTPDGTSYEEYALPNTADYTGGPVLRNILTDKSPVLVTQGGTGATTPAGARNNLCIYPFHTNVNIDSNGQGFINFNSIGMSSQPNVCFMEIVNVTGTIVRYNFGASTSQIVLEPFWINGDLIKNTTIDIQGIAFT